MNKRGALSLGITTIVYLVIAMVIIGAAVSFVQTGFSTGTETLTQAIPSSDLTVNPTRGSPLAKSVDELQIENGGDASVQLGVYNGDTQTLNFSVDTTCKNRTNDDYSEFTTTSIEREIGASEKGGFEVLFIAPDDASDGSPYVCNIEVTGNRSDGTTESTEITMSDDLRIRAAG